MAILGWSAPCGRGTNVADRGSLPQFKCRDPVSRLLDVGQPFGTDVESTRFRSSWTLRVQRSGDHRCRRRLAATSCVQPTACAERHLSLPSKRSLGYALRAESATQHLSGEIYESYHPRPEGRGNCCERACAHGLSHQSFHAFARGSSVCIGSGQRPIRGRDIGH